MNKRLAPERTLNLLLVFLLMIGLLVPLPTSIAHAAPSAPNSWTLTGSMGVGRNEATATLLNNGKVLVVGGDPNTNSSQLYDLATGKWTATASLAQGRMRHAAVPKGFRLRFWSLCRKKRKHH